MTETERFEAKFSPEPNTGCFLWFASTNADGYGQFGAGPGRGAAATAIPTPGKTSTSTRLGIESVARVAGRR